MDQAMIVAGVGCRKGSSSAAVIEAITGALAAHDLPLGKLTKLATGEIKRDEAGIQSAAKELGLPLIIVSDEALSAASARCLTKSEKSAKATGAASLSEAAALAVSASPARLLGPRIALNGVTCALAEGGS